MHNKQLTNQFEKPKEPIHPAFLVLLTLVLSVGASVIHTHVTTKNKAKDRPANYYETLEQVAVETTQKNQKMQSQLLQKDQDINECRIFLDKAKEKFHSEMTILTYERDQYRNHCAKNKEVSQIPPAEYYKDKKHGKNNTITQK